MTPDMTPELELWMAPALKAHIDRLTVGTRVRIRLNGECPGKSAPMWADGKEPFFRIPHAPHEEDGQTGRIIVIDDLFHGHQYKVAYEINSEARHYAAQELEPLD